MKVKGNHPLAEIIAKKLFGITVVPRDEQNKMVNRAAKAAVKYHEQHLKKLESAMHEFIDRCEKGEVRSKYTYSKFKRLLSKPKL